MPKPKTFSELIKREEEIEKNKNGMNWYLSFTNIQDLSRKTEAKK